jgi:hypothetical protein
MICQNPECQNEFTPARDDGQIYCCVKCRNRAMKMRETARRRAKLEVTEGSMTHPCKRCGGPAGYKKVYCEACKAGTKGAGVAPLTTRTIKASRKRELELIERVVAKAIANGSQGCQDIMRFSRHDGIHGVKVG